MGWLDKPLAIPGWSLMSMNGGSVSVTGRPTAMFLEMRKEYLNTVTYNNAVLRRIKKRTV